MISVYLKPPRLLRRAVEMRGSPIRRPHLRVLEGPRHTVWRCRQKRIVARGNKIHSWRLEPFLT